MQRYSFLQKSSLREGRTKPSRNDDISFIYLAYIDFKQAANFQLTFNAVFSTSLQLGVNTL
ncbi:hypothetical protein GGQ60_000829 [Pedobacter zeae]|uniref:Uncharacterized protein n=1 Tax=Pedobacter zeae TaxID=1737356 RepID=A0A7W6P5H0_9SPHI|nr:hypothetical protein [Pedobacter zeae]